MKELVRDFCRGIWDSLPTSSPLLEKMTLDKMTEIVYHAFVSLLIKIVTLVLGIIAGIIASIQFSISFEYMFWLGISFWLVWVLSDDDMKQCVQLIKEIEK